MGKNLTCLIVVLLLSVAHGAPQRQRTRRHNGSSNEARSWVNPCRLQKSQLTTIPNFIVPPKNKTPLKALKKTVETLMHGLHNSAINTSDISEWFRYNSTYSFLRQVDSSVGKIQLRRWHRDTQVYVGAFQYLANKQNRSDRRHNLGNAKSTELIQLMGFARTVLCEIETAINNTNMKMPDVYTRIEMNDTLNFRSDGRSGPDGEVDELDIKFAKVRFDELLYNLNRTLKMKRKKPMQPCKVGKHRRRHPCGGKRDVDDKRANGTTTIESTDLLVVNNGIGRRHPMRRQHQRGQRIGGGGSGGSAGAGVHPNEIFNENGNRVQRPHRRHRQHGERRLRNQLNQQSIDGGLERPHRNRRKKMHRIPTTSSTTFSPLLS